MARRLGATPRQARLVSALRHPEDWLPTHPAIDPWGAWWTAREIVERTGGIGGLFPSRRACLDDLRTLEKRGSVVRMGSRWRYRRHGEFEL